jgi:hypothetical protein
MSWQDREFDVSTVYLLESLKKKVIKNNFGVLDSKISLDSSLSRLDIFQKCCQPLVQYETSITNNHNLLSNLNEVILVMVNGKNSGAVLMTFRRKCLLGLYCTWL